VLHRYLYEGRKCSALKKGIRQPHALPESARFRVDPDLLNVSASLEAEQCLAYIEISEVDMFRSRAMITSEEAERADRVSRSGDRIHSRPAAFEPQGILRPASIWYSGQQS
jgi:hypothetical protein